MNKFSHPTKNLWAIVMLLLLLVIATVAVYAANVTIDDFSTSTQTSLVTYLDGDPFPLQNCTYRSPTSPNTLGGHRDVCIVVTDATTDGDIARLRVTTGQLALSADSSLLVRGFVQWDGTNATEVLDPTGLGGQDLTGGGTNDGILVRIINSDGVPIRITLRIYTNATNWADQKIDLNTTIVAGTDVVDLFYPFANFANQAGVMNPASVGAVEAEILSLSQGPDLNIDLIEATSIYDYGDLPDIHGTTLANDGARHRTTTGLRLGNSVDAENDGIPSSSALGDDSAYVITTLDDEGGVLRQPGLGGNGGWTNGTVSSGQGGRLAT
ncbi:MAG: hypothetical protein V9G20_09135 [Candidatus Promineifilaceae bacterium]